MPSAERTISINQPVEAVFPVVANPLKAPLWRPRVLDVEFVSGSRRAVGTVYRQAGLGPGGRRVETDCEITALEPNRLVAFRWITGPVRQEAEYELEGIGQATALTFRLRANLTGWRRLLQGGAVQSSMNAEMAALDRLRDLLER